MDARNNCIGGGLHLGTLAVISGNGQAVNTLGLSDASWSLAFIFQSETVDPITRLGMLFTSLTGTSPTYRVSLQGVNVTTTPAVADGTVKGGGSPVSKTFNPGSLGWSSNSFNWLTLDNPYTPSRGELLAIVIDYNSGTIDGSNLSTFGTSISDATAQVFPFAVVSNPSASRQTTMPIFGYGTAGQKYGPVIRLPVLTLFSSTTSGADEYGLKFTIPSDWGSTYQLRGVRATCNGSSGSGATTKLVLYGGTDNTAINSTGAVTEATVIQDLTINHNLVINSGGISTFLFDESSLATLYYGATYRVTFQPQNNTNFALFKNTYSANDDLAANVHGTLEMLTKRLDSGNWTDVDTEKPRIELILADITSGGSSAPSLLVMPRRSSVLSKL